MLRSSAFQRDLPETWKGALREVLDDANLVGYHLDIGESPLAGQADVHRLAGVQVPPILERDGRNRE
jgi:hypothetical protein